MKFGRFDVGMLVSVLPVPRFGRRARVSIVMNIVNGGSVPSNIRARIGGLSFAESL